MSEDDVIMIVRNRSFGVVAGQHLHLIRLLI